MRTGVGATVTTQRPPAGTSPPEAEALQQLARLQALTGALASTLDEDEILSVVLSHAALFDASAGLLAMRRGDEVEIVLHFGDSLPDVIDSWRVFPLSMDSLVSDVVRDGQRLVIRDRQEMLARYPALAGSVTFDGVWLGLPLADRDEPLGSLTLRFPPGTALDAETIDYLQLLAHQIGLSLGRARLVEELRSRAELERRLLGIVGHDLRTPLSAILYAAGLLPKDGAVGDLSERIERSARRMSDIIRSAMDLSFEQATASRLVSLDVVVRDQLDELRAAFPDRVLIHRSEVHRTGPVDPIATAQILANLVRNGLEHGDSEGPVTVTLRAVDDEVRVDVHNRNQDGPIPPGQRQRLFDAFTRGDGTRGEGMGLGLYIVRELAQRMGGRIDVASDGSGTVFSLALPDPFASMRPGASA